MNSFTNRLVGSVVAGAIGDALGGPYEGKVSPFELDSVAPLELSDDTQLTLATCEAIGPAGFVTPEVVAGRFLHWYKRRLITGVGASTLKALRDLEVGAHWSLSGRAGEMAAGNGAAMRIAPLSFCIDLGSPDGRSLLRDICWITHQSDEAYCGALAVAASIQAIQSDNWSNGTSLSSLVIEQLPDSNVRDALFAISEMRPGTPIGEVAAVNGCSAYVAESVPLAIYASQFIQELGLEGVLEEVIQSGGDTDTNASITGQITGAWLGVDQIPQVLLKRLPDSEMVFETALGLARRLEIPNG